jgi:ribosomal protein S18 acetylase RimI-like enzyme
VSERKFLHIAALDLQERRVVGALVRLQRAAYRVEARLIGSDAIPALHETPAELAASEESFVGVWEQDELVGAVSWRVIDGVLDIHRLVVSPSRFRSGIGRSLVRDLLRRHATLPAIVQTGVANIPARTLYESEGFVVAEELEPTPGLCVVRFRRPSQVPVPD